MKEEYEQPIDLTGSLEVFEQDPFNGALNEVDQLVTSSLVGFLLEACEIEIEGCLSDKSKKQSYTTFPFLFNRFRVKKYLEKKDAKKTFMKSVFGHVKDQVVKDGVVMSRLSQRVKTEAEEDAGREKSSGKGKRKVWLGCH
jgi:hypothetical protein